MDVPTLAGEPGYPVEGPRSAPVRMLVFSDYACGVCRRVEPYWREAAAEAGDVQIVYRDWPILGESSQLAARAALAADRQGVHAAFHRAMISGSRLDEAGLRAALAEAGGDWARLERDLQRYGAAIDRLLARSARDAFQLGFRGTPAFLIGPIRIEGGASTRQFARAIATARG
ncbi:DsbA family protein [Qipengyuania sediminis]|uniref:DsbA family protein n=1 Tax=Qipengyuania sediminis TaxID=1532023 RepID=UPI001059E374|nr:DsbA family protein [Qipengyuania sediminis]